MVTMSCKKVESNIHLKKDSKITLETQTCGTGGATETSANISTIPRILSQQCRWLQHPCLPRTPCHTGVCATVDLKIDKDTAEAYCALLKSQEDKDFWKAANDLSLTKPCDKARCGWRLSLPPTRALLQDLCLVVVLSRRVKGFDYMWLMPPGCMCRLPISHSNISFGAQKNREPNSRAHPGRTS